MTPKLDYKNKILSLILKFLKQSQQNKLNKKPTGKFPMFICSKIEKKKYKTLKFA